MKEKKIFDWHRQDTRATELGNVCTTVSASYGGGGNNMPYVIEEDQKTEEPYCLAKAQHFTHPVNDGTTSTLYTSDHKDPQIINAQAVVRRLTPMECERLQGFPDNWTNIGEWTDTKGKKHKDADSPRYKALGNSIALPFWEWMAERMVANYDRPTTLASLFDGIGGFPLVFSRHGCTPVWASEIEEFPIAVTKKHFPEENEK